MKRFTNLILLLLLPSWLLAQPGISQVEYWYDGDYGTAVQQTVSGPSVLFANLLDVSSLEPGLHTVTFRFQDERGVWGSVLSKLFTYSEEALPGVRMITDVEFWYDGNYALAVKTPLTPGVSADWNSLLDVSSLNDGLHTLSYRFKDDRGIWSSPSVRFFRMDEATGLQQIVGLEYWFDDDYANKEASTFPATSLLNLNEMLDVSSLAGGLHILSVRLQDESGRWNAPACYYFTNYEEETAVLHQITELEYWFDNDYSSVQTDPVAATSLLNIDDQIDVSGLTDGMHVVSCRFRDESGEWSPAYSVLFTKYTEESAAELHEITELEYWFDGDYSSVQTDPVANAAFLSINEQIDVSALSDGLHFVSSRFKDEAGNWSSAYATLFVKYPPDPTPDLHEIVKVEYWIDGDHTQVSTKSVASTGMLVIDEQLDVSALNNGLHTLTYRFGDEAGGWSSAITTFFSLYDDEIVSAENKIVAYRYWPDSDIASVREVEIASPVKSFKLDDVIDLNGYPGGEHIISIQFLDSEGQWSSAYSETYTKEVIPSITISASDSTICLGESVIFSAQIFDADVVEWDFGDGNTSNEITPVHDYSTPGNYQVSAIATNTDSMKSAYDTITGGINVYPNYSVTIDTTVCESDLPYVLGTQNLLIAGTFVDTFTSVNSCDSIVTVNLDVIPSASSTSYDTVCESSLPYIFGSQSLSNSGTYVENIPTGAGCDSMVTLHLLVKDTSVVYTTETICESELPFIFGTQTLTVGGDYNEIFTADNACDSTVYLQLNITDTFITHIQLDLCETEVPYILGSQSLNASGVYTEVFPSSLGCDSTVILDLNVLDTSLVNREITICESLLPYTFGTQSLVAGGVYSEKFPKANGCDSTVVLQLNVNDTFIVSDAVTLCESELPYTWGGDNLITAGSYSKVFTTQSGCDSTVNLQLTVNDTSVVAMNLTVCENDLPYTLGAQTLTGSGTYNEVFTKSNGCDSTVILTLNVSDTLRTNLDISVCENNLPYTFGTSNLMSSGVYSDTLVNTNGCDSIVILTLTVNDTFFVSDAVAVCESELPYNWEGDELMIAGPYTKTLSTEYGCDSTVTLTLTVNDTSLTHQEFTICESELPYSFGSQTLTFGGSYTEVYSKANGCDSTVEITLNVLDSSLIMLETDICESELPYVLGTQSIDSSGVYTEVFTAENGCDSTVILTLTVNDTFWIADTVSICENDLPFTFGSQTLDHDGTYTELFTSSFGCDSTVVLVFSVTDTTHSRFADTVCENELPYIFGNQSLNTSGTYLENFASENGCDSLVTLDLLVNKSYRTELNVKVEPNDLPYVFGGQNLSKTGEYTNNLFTVNGCDSIIILHLTVGDDIAPVVSCHSINVELSEQGDYTFSESDIEALTKGTYDNITNYNDLYIEVTPSELGCQHVGSTQISILVRDEAGNKSWCKPNIFVTLVDKLPVLDVIPDLVANEDDSVAVILTGISAGNACEQWNAEVTAYFQNTNLINNLALNYIQGESTATLAIELNPQQNGSDTIWVTVKDSLGRSAVQSFALTVNPVNDPPVLIRPFEDQSIEASDTFEVIINKADGSFIADFDDTTLVFNAYLLEGVIPSWIVISEDDEKFVLTFTPSVADSGCFNMVVEASDEEGYTIADTFRLCIEPAITVGIFDSNGAFEVRLYPNPTEGKVNIDFSNNPPGDIELMVTDLRGSRVLRKKFLSGERIQFDISEHVSGTYLVVLKINEKRIVRKIILDKK